MIDRKEMRLAQRVEDRMFADPEVRRILDELAIEDLRDRFGEPLVDTQYAMAPGWQPGEPRPALATDDVAVMQAIGRCASSRIRNDVQMAALGAAHPRPCGWCDYPLPELLAACSWAVWAARLILSETLTWTGANGSHYTRAGQHNVFTNPMNVAFWGSTRQERGYLVNSAIERSRE